MTFLSIAAWLSALPRQSGPASMHREGWQSLDLFLVELQEHRILARNTQCRNGDDHFLLSAQMSFSHHQMSYIAVLWVDREFVDVPNITIRRLDACTSAHSQLPRWDLLIVHGLVFYSFGGHIG